MLQRVNEMVKKNLFSIHLSRSKFKFNNFSSKLHRKVVAMNQNVVTTIRW